MSWYHDISMDTIRNEIELGRAVRSARKRLGLTQAELAQQAQVSRAYLIMLEQGKGIRAELGRALSVIRALGLQIKLIPNPPISFEDALEQLLDKD